MTDQKLLTPEQVAERLQVTVQTIYAWIRAGDLPSVRMGRLVRVDPVDLEKFIEKRKSQKD